jgi:hypothetical protein
MPTPPLAPDFDAIAKRVINEVLVPASGKTAEQITEAVDSQEDRLYDDLGLGPVAIDSLAEPLTKISTSYPGGLPVTIADVRQCETVRSLVIVTRERAVGNAPDSSSP